ncbi:MAG: LamG domain-containing protein [Dehalococcoidales bacterium]
MNFIFDPSLVLYLPLYELDGSSFASKDAYGHVCTVTGALWRPNGHYFDGTDDYIDCGSGSSFDVTDNVTLEVWIYVTSTAGSRYICGKNPDKWALMFSNGSMIPASYMDGVVHKSHGAAAAINQSEWYQLAFTYDKDGGSNNRSIYINGRVSAQQTTTGAIGTSATSFFVGSYDAVPNNPFDGRIGEVRVYNRALNPQEIQHNYLATKWRYR